MENEKIAVCYARFSSNNQREESIDAQVREVKKYSKEKNFTLIDFYIDEAKTGTNDDRPSFKQMIKDSYNKKFNYVIVHKFDRFARNTYDSKVYKKELKDNNVRVISTVESIDNGRVGEFFENMIEVQNEYFSANLSDEIKKGKRENANKCLHNGGKPPFGFDVNDKKKYVINEYEKYAVEKIFKMHVEGNTYNKIVDWLNQNGYKTKRENKFYRSALQSILKNKKYIGTYTYGKLGDEDFISIQDGIPRIIENELFYKSQERMNSNILKNTSKNKVYLLTGKIKCDICGGSMGGYSRGKNSKRTYYCNTRKKDKEKCDRKEINSEYLENIILGNMQNKIFCNKNINYILNKLEEKSKNIDNNNEAEKKRYKVVIKQINKKINNILAFIEQGIFTDSTHIRLLELEKEKALIDKKILNLKYKKKLPTKEEIVNLLKIGIDVKEKSIEEQKATVDIFVESIVVNNITGEVKIIYKFNNYMRPMSNSLQRDIHKFLDVYILYLEKILIVELTKNGKEKRSNF